MLAFGIDTCCAAATAALIDETRLIAETFINTKKTHSEKMLPQIDNMLAFAEVDINDADCFCVACGPGSFTGVRIGVAMVKAFAEATGKPCVSVSTLHALANNVGVFNGIICPILDARRNQVYNALFRGGESLVRICDDRALGLDELLVELKEYTEPVIFLGDGVLVYEAEIKEALGESAIFAPVSLRLNLAASVAEVGLKLFKEGKTTPVDELSPQYLRLSQAEREKNMKKDGINK